MIVIQTQDAKADYHRLTAAGISCSDPFHFSRGNQLADGSIVEVAFTTSFFQSELLSGLAFFVCQHHHPEYIWQTAYQQHENTSLSIASIDIVVDYPDQVLPFIQLIFDSYSYEKISDGFQLQTENERIYLITKNHFEKKYNTLIKTTTPFIGGIEIKVKNLEQAQKRLAEKNIPFKRKEHVLLIDSNNAFGVNLLLSL